MNLISIAYPDHRPTMPATPANTGGAGTGSLNAAKAIPQINPVKTDKNISFIIYPLIHYKP